MKDLAVAAHQGWSDSPGNGRKAVGGLGRGMMGGWGRVCIVPSSGNHSCVCLIGQVRSLLVACSGLAV